MTPNPEPFPQFELLKFNPIRRTRGKEAAWLKAQLEREVFVYLWMSEDDIRANIRDHGAHPQLLKALEAYRIGEWFPKKTT
jgi:hypothetical protein